MVEKSPCSEATNFNVENDELDMVSFLFFVYGNQKIIYKGLDSLFKVMKYHSELTEAVNEKKKCSGKLRKLPSSVLVTKFIFVKLFCYPVNLLIKSSANGIF